MKHAILLCLALCAPAFAQPVTQDEIAFWETVRDSRNAAELQAYIDTYPKGKFVVLARARLAALAQKPAAQPAPAQPPQAVPPVAASSPVTPGEMRMPKPGDTWTYRLTPVRKWGSPTSSIAAGTLVVTLTSAADGRIVEQVTQQGAAFVVTTHGGREVVTQGVSVFSPYLTFFDKPPSSGRLGPITVSDCGGTYVCEAKGRVVGTETVRVAAGSFVASKVIIDEEWRPRVFGARLFGGRTLTVWYAPEIGRAVKFSSRATVGDQPPIEPNFDLELTSYEFK